MEGESLTPSKALYVIDQYIAEEDYKSAFAICMCTLMSCPPCGGTVPKENLAIKRLARIFAEINGAFPNDQGRKQTPAAVQLLVFSKVKPNEWLGTQGVAAAMLKRETSSIGDVVMNYETMGPLLVQGDDYCAACNKIGCRTICSTCKNVFYCDKACQKDDWIIHKLKCAASANRGAIMWNSTELYETQLKEMRETIAEGFSKK